MNMNKLAALVLGTLVGLGGAWAQEAVQPALPKRTAEIVAADLLAVETEQKSLAQKETEVLAALRTQAPVSTNLVDMAGGDEKLAAKMKNIQDLQEKLIALKAEVRTEMAANPVLQERRARMEQRRSQLLEIQEARKTLEIRKKTLLVEQDALKAPLPEPAAK